MATDKRRASAWSFILYPESSPGDWIDIINDMHLEFFVSPIHDKDTDPDGEIKKPHYHVMVNYQTLKSFDQVKELTDLLKQPIPQKVHNTRSLLRYFVHLDNPDKYQYNQSEIQCFGGADIGEALKPTYTEKSSMMYDIIGFIQENGITELQEIVDYSRINNTEWFQLLSESCYFVNQYLKSARHRVKEEIEKG